MTNMRWSDREIEALFAGKTPTDGDLARLTPLVDEIRGDARSFADSARVEKVVRSLAEAAREGAGRPISRRERRALRTPVPWGRRFVAVGGVAVLATMGIGGVAVAANGAAPGDLLYSVDRAFEAVGIGNGGPQERLHEAVRLADEGNVDGALRHAAHAVQTRGDAGTAGTLETTATEITGLAPGDEAQVREAVSDMLQWMESTDANRSDFGQGVAERARAIGDTAARGHAAQNDATQGKSGSGSQGNSGDTSQANSKDKPHGKPTVGPGSSGNAGANPKASDGSTDL